LAAGDRRAGGDRIISSVRRYCREHEIGEQSFYAWRRRLHDSEPVRFALVDTSGLRTSDRSPELELVLATGERLRIGAGVDAATLRTVVEVLRA
jgi:transposase-like protein